MAGVEAKASLLTQLRSGIFLCAEGASFLRQERRLWPLATLPVIFAVLAVGSSATVFWLRLDEIHAIFAGLLPTLEATAWWTWIWVGPGKALLFLMAWAAVLVSFAVSLVAALLLANLASAPFLDALSQRVEAIISGQPSTQVEGWSVVLSDAFRSFVAELQRVAFLVGLWALLTAAGFLVPGAHLVTGPVLVTLTILFLPLDYAGFALDRRGVSFASRRAWLWAHRPMMAGFGSVAFLSCMVPGLNLVVLPSLVTAGTLLVLRRPPEVGQAKGVSDGRASAPGNRGH
jgi:CysZ protein